MSPESFGQTPPAGWYPDKSVDAPVGQQRYWDGSAWTQAWTQRTTAPTTAPTVAAPTVATGADYQPPPAYQAGVQQAPRNGLGTAALVLGIIGAVSGVIPFMFWLAGTLGLIGLILGFIARGRVKRGEAINGTATLWGIITNAVALVLSVVGLVLLVSVLGTVAENVGTTPAEPAPQPAQTAAPEPEPAEAGIGDTVNDGQFDFVVTAVEPPVETLGEGILADEAQGQFVIVRITVTNVGDEARNLNSSFQYLYDAEGRKYETSSAIFTLPDYDKAFLENVNPGNTVTDAPLLYDVPDGFVPASLELHDSVFSGGVTVTLTP